jgi:hypothetical protein
MEVVYRFLATYEGLIYILLALAGLFAFRWVWKSWREWRDSVFGLEREFAMRRLSQSALVSLLIVILFFGELFLVSFAIPMMPASDMLATPTLDLLNSTPLSGSAAAETVVPNSASGAVSNSSDGCRPNEIIITSPEPGEQVSGTVTLIGTVVVDNFGFYKYEVSPAGAGAWATISAGRDPVQNGELGLWDTTALTPGDYELSLEVIDNQGQLFQPCVIPVRVVAEAP